MHCVKDQLLKSIVHAYFEMEQNLSLHLLKRLFNRGTYCRFIGARSTLLQQKFLFRMYSRASFKQLVVATFLPGLSKTILFQAAGKGIHSSKALLHESAETSEGKKCPISSSCDTCQNVALAADAKLHQSIHFF